MSSILKTINKYFLNDNNQIINGYLELVLNFQNCYLLIV